MIEMCSSESLRESARNHFFVMPIKYDSSGLISCVSFGILIQFVDIVVGDK